MGRRMQTRWRFHGGGCRFDVASGWVKTGSNNIHTRATYVCLCVPTITIFTALPKMLG